MGLAAMGTARSDIYELLKNNLFMDDAVAGEAAGIAMGLVMLGTKSAGAIEDMVTVSCPTLAVILSQCVSSPHIYVSVSHVEMR